jgi:hypothetical protein
MVTPTVRGKVSERLWMVVGPPLPPELLELLLLLVETGVRDSWY